MKQAYVVFMPLIIFLLIFIIVMVFKHFVLFDHVLNFCVGCVLMELSIRISNKIFKKKK